LTSDELRGLSPFNLQGDLFPDPVRPVSGQLDSNELRRIDPLIHEMRQPVQIAFDKSD
jgi:hypothetical protein